MSIKINGTDVVDNNRKGIFQSTNVGTFANPARPGSAATGDLIWSTTDNQLQVWNGSAWVAAVGAGQAITASGGSEFTPGNGFKLHVFTSPGTFTLSSPSAQVEHAIVAGGGGSGAYAFAPGTYGWNAPGGAGGGGGVLITTATLSAGSYTITIGSGGAGGSAGSLYTPGAVGSNGGNSSISGPSGTWTATGGGGGASFRYTGSGGAFMGNPGGSGGGTAGSQGAATVTGATGTPGQGYPAGGFVQGFPIPHPGVGPISGGGGGADQPGGDGNIGARQFGRGFGINWGIPGSYGTSSDPMSPANNPYSMSANSPARALGRFFGGGGGGGSSPYIPMPIGYVPGGGGRGDSSGLGNSGGGGGHKNSPAPTNGTSGGSGIVIIRYRTVQ